MIRGIYTSASGMLTNFRRQKVIADNLANVTTTGYKQDIAEPTEGPEMQIRGDMAGRRENLLASPSLGVMGMGTMLQNIQLDPLQGDLMETGNPLDIAITGGGYLPVQTPSGVLYTRDGTLFRDSLGRLAKADGGLVLGDNNGPINVGQGDVTIEGDGTVKSDGEVVGRIQLYDLPGQLVKVGNNYIAPQDGAAAPTLSQESQISQGFLERSNVNLSQTMVDMMAVSRLYEASQRMVVMQDTTLEKAVNEVAKV